MVATRGPRRKLAARRRGREVSDRGRIEGPHASQRSPTTAEDVGLLVATPEIRSGDLQGTAEGDGSVGVLVRVLKVAHKEIPLAIGHGEVPAAGHAPLLELTLELCARRGAQLVDRTAIGGTGEPRGQCSCWRCDAEGSTEGGITPGTRDAACHDEAVEVAGNAREELLHGGDSLAVPGDDGLRREPTTCEAKSGDLIIVLLKGITRRAATATAGANLAQGQPLALPGGELAVEQAHVELADSDVAGNITIVHVTLVRLPADVHGHLVLEVRDGMGLLDARGADDGGVARCSGCRARWRNGRGDNRWRGLAGMARVVHGVEERDDAALCKVQALVKGINVDGADGHDHVVKVVCPLCTLEIEGRGLAPRDLHHLQLRKMDGGSMCPLLEDRGKGTSDEAQLSPSRGVGVLELGSAHAERRLDGTPRVFDEHSIGARPESSVSSSGATLPRLAFGIATALVDGRGAGAGDGDGAGAATVVVV
jgi:hypothetical protein